MSMQSINDAGSCVLQVRKLVTNVHLCYTKQRRSKLHMIRHHLLRIYKLIINVQMKNQNARLRLYIFRKHRKCVLALVQLVLSV